MKPLLLIAATLILLPPALRAQDLPATAWKALVQEQNALKDAIILGAQMTENDAGRTWEFQLLDTNYKSDRRIVQWSAGKAGPDRAGRMKAFERADLIPLASTNLNLSLAPVRAKTRELLTDAGRKAQSIEYALSRKTGQEQPQWTATCLGEDGSRLAVMTFGADNHQLLLVDLEPGNPKIRAVKKDAKSFGNDVEKTFKNIGGELEEFFTGKRTVDR